MKVWDLRERLATVDQDAEVVIISKKGTIWPVDSDPESDRYVCTSSGFRVHAFVLDRRDFKL